MLRYITTAAILLIAGSAIAQSLAVKAEPEAPKHVKFPKAGISYVAKDSLYSVNFRFRMQNRAAMLTESADNLSTEEWEFRVRRLRMRFEGFVIDPRFNYYIQLSFSRGDMDFNAAEGSKINTSPNVVRDAVVYYRPNEHWRLGMGQTKLPGNRQRVVSSGELQFVDRSIVNATFNIDRDFGFFATYENSLMNEEKMTFLLKGAVSSGKGRMNVVSNNPGLCYTARAELLPFGKFTNNGDYFEGDLEREQKPKLSLAGGFALNTNAVRTGGQIGRDLPRDYDMGTLILDGVFKYRGWALYSEYMKRSSRNQPDIAEGGISNYIYIGEGHQTQLSYCFKNRFELAGRFARVTPFKAVNDVAKQETNYTFGVSKYLSHHRVKLQWNLTYIEREDLRSKVMTDQFYSAFQIELGI